MDNVPLAERELVKKDRLQMGSGNLRDEINKERIVGLS